MKTLIVKAMAALAHRMRLASSAWRKFMICLTNANVSFGPGVRIDRNVIMRTYDGGVIHIGAGTHIWPGAIIDARTGTIRIGKNGLINAGTYIVAAQSILIGEDALIAEYVTIRDQDHATDQPGRPYAEQGNVSAPVTIGNNVWLGAKVTVTKGVDIKDGVIVGANSVVTRSLPSGKSYAGCPARPIDRTM